MEENTSAWKIITNTIYIPVWYDFTGNNFIIAIVYFKLVQFPSACRGVIKTDKTYIIIGYSMCSIFSPRFQFNFTRLFYNLPQFQIYFTSLQFNLSQLQFRLPQIASQFNQIIISFTTILIIFT